MKRNDSDQFMRRGSFFGRGLRVIVTGTLAALLLAGCGASNNSADYGGVASSPQNSASFATEAAGADYNYGFDGYEAEYDVSAEKAVSVTEPASTLSERKLIRTVDMEVETKEQDYDMFLATLQEEVRSRGGYIESMDSYNGSSYGGYRSSRSTNLTLRIPKEHMDGFLNLVSEISNVVRRSDSVEDVTLTYVDLASHRNALRTEQDRLLELLERAETIEDIITIESRLSSVRYQLESMESQLRTMDNQVDYGTVYMYVSEVKELTPVVEQTVWERIAYGFRDSLEEIGDGAVDIFVWFLVNLPFIVLWVAGFAAFIIFIKIYWKKSVGSGKQKAKKGEEKQINQSDPKG